MTAGSLADVMNGDLYSLLALSTREELEPLVDCVLSRLTNLLDVNEDYKRHSPDHTKYHTVIGDEIRLFGGNSIANLGRGGAGPPYDEIVVDVCKKLNVPHAACDTVGNESNLLDIFLERRWQSLKPAERERLAADVRKAALDKTSERNWYASTSVLSAIGSRLFMPAGLAFLGLSLFDAAYKVTVPCVLHIAFLRRKILEEGRASRRSGVSALPTSKTIASTVRGPALVVGGEDGTAALSFVEIERAPSESWLDLRKEDGEINRLSPLLQAVPALGTALEVGTTRYMEVVCDGELVNAAGGNGLRAWSKNAKGIKEHATLFDPDRLSALVNASALMNVASVALAQKHLADISEKLSSIKDAVGEIARFQKDERRSVLTGSIHYFGQVAPAILAGELPDRVLDQIERHEADLLRVQHHLSEDIRAKVDAIQSLKDEGWFGTKGITETLAEHQGHLDDLCRELFLCLRARACGWQLLCVFPGGDLVVEQRRNDIERSLDELDVQGEKLTAVDALLREKIHGVSSFWSPSTANERKLSLLRAGDAAFDNLSAERSRIFTDLRAANDMRVARRGPVTMALKVEDGQITAVQTV